MHENLVRMKAVGRVLNDLKQDYVFVGGATVALYATNSELATEVRPTDDVDVIVELATYKGYSDLDERLRAIDTLQESVDGIRLFRGKVLLEEDLYDALAGLNLFRGLPLG